MTILYDKVTIIGLGLIGASIALATRRAGVVGHITGCDSGDNIADEIASLNLVDSFVADPGDAVNDADLVIMAVPVGALGALSAAIIPKMKPGAVLSDTGSTKRSVMRDVAPNIAPHIH